MINMCQCSGKPLSIYVHIPFCVKKCAYCDFLSFPAEKGDMARYLDALLYEIESKAQELADCEVKTVFIGGGAPTLLPPEHLCRVLRTISNNYNFCPEPEITVEANPKTVSRESLSTLRACGANRLSMGLQSDNDRLLRLIGRIHDCRTFDTNYEDARAAGFDNVNIDIMFALPSQSLDEWRQALDYVVSKSPEHISAYGLSLEEGTPLYHSVAKGELVPPDEDTYIEMYRMAVKRLQSAGYERYEISNFAKPGRRCRHNMTYWRCEEYVGFGIGAASYFRSVRFRNDDGIKRYLKREFIRREEQEITENEAMSEFMLLGLRMAKGVSEEAFMRKFGADMNAHYGKTLGKFAGMGLLKREKGRVFLTERGVEVSNRVLAEFL